MVNGSFHPFLVLYPQHDRFKAVFASGKGVLVGIGMETGQQELVSVYDKWSEWLLPERVPRPQNPIKLSE